MTPPEEIPEDREESYECPFCPIGNVTLQGEYWTCDRCDFISHEKDKMK